MEYHRESSNNGGKPTLILGMIERERKENGDGGLVSAMPARVMRGRRASGRVGVDGLACDARREPLPSCRRVCVAACDAFVQASTVTTPCTYHHL